MNLTEMTNAIREAEATLARADMVTTDMAKLLVGRLRKVDRYGVLKALKMELRDYDSRTCTWREPRQ